MIGRTILLPGLALLAILATAFVWRMGWLNKARKPLPETKAKISGN